MRDIWRIYWRDLRRLFMNFSMALVAVGVSVIPAFYAWFNIAADMDPYGRTGNILVAVSSDDRTVHTSELGDLNVGDMLVKELRKNHQLGWRFVSTKEATDGVRSAKYAAAIVVPRNFSHRLYQLTDVTATGKRTLPAFDYYVNEKISAIEPKVTDSGAGTLQETINSTVVQTASKAIAQQIKVSAGKLQSGATRSVDRAGASIAEAAAGLDTVRTNLTDLTDGLARTRTVVGTSRTNLQSLARQADSLRRDLNSTQPAISDARASAGSLASQSSSLLNRGLGQTGSAIGTLSSSVGSAAGQVLSATAPVDSALADMQSMNSQAGDLLSRLQSTQSDIDRILNDPAVTGSLPADVLSQLRGVHSRLESVTSQLSQQHSDLGETISSLQSVSSHTGSLATSVTRTAGTLASTTNAQLGTLSQLNSNLTGITLPALNTALDGLNTTSAQIGDQLTTLALTARNASGTLGQLDRTLGQLSGALTRTGTQIGDARDSLASLARDVAAISSSQAISELSQLLNINPGSIGSFMASPANLRTVTLYPVKNYGTSMTPIYTNVTLWVGCIMLVIVLRMEVDDRDLDVPGKRRVNPTPSKTYLARYLLLATIAVAQAVVVAVGDMLLGIGVAHPFVFVLSCVLCSLVYLAICYMLASCFQHIGKALCIILIIIQIPGTTGVYPIEMMPAFYQALRPIEPWNYGMQMMREAIGGYYDDNYGHDLLALLVFTLLAFALGLGLRPHLTNLNGMFDREIAKTDFYNGEVGDLPPARVGLHQVMRTLASRSEFRERMLRKAAGFDRAFPYLITAGFVLLFLLPTVPFLMSLTPNSKLVNLGVWVILVVLVLSFVVVIEYAHEALHRELQLSDMTESDLRALMQGQTGTGTKPGWPKPNWPKPGHAGPFHREPAHAKTTHGTTEEENDD